MPSHVACPTARGAIMPIGGAEEKVGGRAVLERFVAECGGRDARVVVVPTASQLEDTGQRYRDLFLDLGCAEARILGIRTREDAQARGVIAPLDGATGVFLTGGTQLLLSTVLGGTPVATAIRRLNAHGAPVAGTSAGAAFVSEHMIAYGAEGLVPRVGEVTLAPGLGLTNRVVVDQHFRQRGRLGRLLAALALNPFLQGLGLDEDTAVVIGPDNELEVVGSGGVTIIDVSGIEHSSVVAAKPGDPLQVIGVRMHVLANGARYHLDKREARPGQG